MTGSGSFGTNEPGFREGATSESARQRPERRLPSTTIGDHQPDGWMPCARRRAPRRRHRGLAASCSDGRLLHAGTYILPDTFWASRSALWRSMSSVRAYSPTCKDRLRRAHTSVARSSRQSAVFGGLRSSSRHGLTACARERPAFGGGVLRSRTPRTSARSTEPDARSLRKDLSSTLADVTN